MDKDFLQSIKDNYDNNRDYTFDTPDETGKISESFAFDYLIEGAFMDASSFGGLSYIQNSDVYPLTQSGKAFLEQSEIDKTINNIINSPKRKAIGMIGGAILVVAGLVIAYCSMGGVTR
jgi:hypothetical protein